MKIIAGRLRRRVLLTNPGNTTRPMLQRAKVMLFDYIRDYLPGARVADLFCGTGTLGFESLSRGAKSVVFGERDHRAHEYLVKNAEALGVSDEVLCWRIDIAKSSLKPKGDTEWYPYDVVFFDPPYVAAKEIQPGGSLYRCVVRMARPDITSEKCKLIVRTPKEEEYPLPPPWIATRELNVASMRIIIAEKSPDAPVVADDEIEADVEA
jgi:16S rRNA (guanine966-N2)-methyltransferase